MARSNGFWEIAAIITAATFGDGVFALPFVFYQAGWLIALGYLAILATIIVGAHVVYLKTLEKVGEKERLLGLARRYLGDGGFWVGFVAIVLGLLLTLVAYLILGTQFITILFPGSLPGAPLLVFWLFTSLLVLASDRHIVGLELAGIICTSCIVILIFVTAWPHVVFAGIPMINTKNIFLPFGVILFELAGWTGIEPAYESRKRGGRKYDPWRALATGTFVAALLSLIFVTGILGSATHITTDTISGLSSWPIWKRDVLAVLGLCAVATVFMPIAREIKNSLEKDLKWKKTYSRGLIILLPIVCISLGLNNFLVVVGIVGGVFLSTQYLLIVSVGRRALTLSGAKKFLLDVVAGVFVVAAIYQIYSFIVK
jgi:tyrosine-specific transport protein